MKSSDRCGGGGASGLGLAAGASSHEPAPPPPARAAAALGTTPALARHDPLEVLRQTQRAAQRMMSAMGTTPTPPGGQRRGAAVLEEEEDDDFGKVGLAARPQMLRGALAASARAPGLGQASGGGAGRLPLLGGTAAAPRPPPSSSKPQSPLLAPLPILWAPLPPLAPLPPPAPAPAPAAAPPAAAAGPEVVIMDSDGEEAEPEGGGAGAAADRRGKKGRGGGGGGGRPKAAAAAAAADGDDGGNQPAGSQQQRSYRPKWGTANHAFLVALYMEHKQGSPHLLKDELISAAEATGLYRGASLRVAPSSQGWRGGGGGGRGGGGGFGGGGRGGGANEWDPWAGNKTLARHGLLERFSNPLKLRLTPLGRQVAAGMYVEAVERRELTPVPGLDATADASGDFAAGGEWGPDGDGGAAGGQKGKKKKAPVRARAVSAAEDEDEAGAAAAAAAAGPSTLPSPPPPRETRVPTPPQVLPDAREARLLRALADMGFEGPAAVRALRRSAAAAADSDSLDDAALMSRAVNELMGDGDEDDDVVLHVDDVVLDADDAEDEDATEVPLRERLARQRGEPAAAAAANSRCRRPRAELQAEENDDHEKPPPQSQQLQRQASRASAAVAPAAAPPPSALLPAPPLPWLSPRLCHRLFGSPSIQPGPSHAFLSRACTMPLRLPPTLPPGERFGDWFRVALLLDHREALSGGEGHVYNGRGGREGAGRAGALERLSQALRALGVPVQQACLPAGDMLWVAQPLPRGRGGGLGVAAGGGGGFGAVGPPSSSQSNAATATASTSTTRPECLFALDWVVERKSYLDLHGSIADRRYERQKSALRACGLRHVLYLLEGSPDDLGGGCGGGGWAAAAGGGAGGSAHLAARARVYGGGGTGAGVSSSAAAAGNNAHLKALGAAKSACATAAQRLVAARGFRVVESASPADTRRLLAEATRVLQLAYEGRRAPPADAICASSLLPLSTQQEEELAVTQGGGGGNGKSARRQQQHQLQPSSSSDHLPSVADWSAAVKRRAAAVTVRDVWRGMLTSAHGVGAEAAAAVSRAYPTPSALQRAYGKATRAAGRAALARGLGAREAEGAAREAARALLASLPRGGGGGGSNGGSQATGGGGGGGAPQALVGPSRSAAIFEQLFEAGGWWHPPQAKW